MTAEPLLLLVLLAGSCGAGPIEFTPVVGFPKTPAEITLGPCSAVAVDDIGEIYVFHRGKSPILRFDPDGKFIKAWGDDLIGKAHGIRTDKERNVWVTCVAHHVVLKYSPEGKLLLALGTADKPGAGNDQFDQPTDIAFGSEGQVYVSDGYGNSRVVEFDRRGAFVKTWGKKGTAPGEFNLPHAVRVDAKGRILVADRENKRLQVFDKEGKSLDVWTGFAPYGLEIDREGTIFVTDALENQVVQLDSSGKVVTRWGGKGTAPGQFSLCHMLSSNARGDLFVAEVEGQRVQMFRRK